MKAYLWELLMRLEDAFHKVNPFEFTLVRRGRLAKLLQDEATVYRDYAGNWPEYRSAWEEVMNDDGKWQLVKTGKEFRPWKAKPLHNWEHHGH